MSTQFRIFTEKEFAHRRNKPDKYVCYRTVLSHALLRKLRLSSKEDAKKVFLKFKQAFESDQQFTDDEFIFFYPIPMGARMGYLIVDKSRGYYPLVLYPYNVNGETRTRALKMVLKDMTENIDSLLNLLQKQKTWSVQLQSSLQDRIFHYAEDKNKAV